STAASADAPSSASPTTSNPSASSNALAKDRKPESSSTITNVGRTSRSSHAVDVLASGLPLGSRPVQSCSTGCPRAPPDDGGDRLTRYERPPAQTAAASEPPRTAATCGLPQIRAAYKLRPDSGPDAARNAEDYPIPAM